MILKKEITTILTCFLCLITVGSLMSQTPDDIQSSIQKAKEKGYTTEQIRSLAISRGVSKDKINEALGGNKKTTENRVQVKDALTINSASSSGSTDNIQVVEKKKDPLFGYDFFNNQNISFQPNLNLATPANYELGPGDALVISLWGATENSYSLEVNRNGTIKIPNIGPVIVSGMTIEAATSKINNKLLKVYRGIAASDKSPYKIFTDVSLSSVRTVQVNIIGEVKVPGTYALSALSTVLNALYACGGPTKQGTFREIKLIRDGEEVSSFDIYKYLTAGSQEGNMTIQDQDVIIVGTYISKVKISGSVKRPGIYEIKERENFSDLLNYVSGFKSDAYKEVIKLERISGDRKKLKEISYSEFKDEKLFDGDVISVGGIIDEVENRVTISGAVFRPGDYEYTSGMTILQLIEKASGLRESAYFERVLVSSKVEGKIVQTESYALDDILSKKNEVVLKVNDVVRILNKSLFKEQGTISIGGAVNNPTSIPFVEGLTLEELVVLAQGYRKEADTRVIDITREIIDDDYNTINETFKIEADSSLNINNNTPFVFQPNDVIIVRYLKGALDNLSATITGEVLYPGRYLSTFKNETILDLIEKSGGLSPYAFAEGATLVRQNPFYNEVAQQLTAQTFNDSTASKDVNLDLNNRKEFRVGINLGVLLKDGRSSKQNMILKEGDQLIIPSIKETIKVEGEVMLPSLIRYDKPLSFKAYINKSGGFNQNAKKRKSYVIYPNGDIAATKQFLFFKSYPKIKPGSLLIIPAKEERRVNGLNAQEVVGLSTGFATLALLIERLFN